jgi:transposase
MAKDTIGIDVSKDRLDAFWHSQDAALSLPNTVEGFAQLCTWLGKNKGVLVVFEATGAYHRGLERYLSLAGQPFIKVNPKQARRFAQAIGRLAKTDSVDARMLARMGVVLDLAPQGIEGEDVHDLRELLTARRAMVKDQITAKTRLATASNPLVKDQLCRRIDDIDTDIKALDQVIAQIAQQRGTLDERIRRLMTIPGIGRLTAATLRDRHPQSWTLSTAKRASVFWPMAGHRRTGATVEGNVAIAKADQPGGAGMASDEALYLPCVRVAIGFTSARKGKAIGECWETG